MIKAKGFINIPVSSSLKFKQQEKQSIQSTKVKESRIIVVLLFPLHLAFIHIILYFSTKFWHQNTEYIARVPKLNYIIILMWLNSALNVTTYFLIHFLHQICSVYQWFLYFKRQKAEVKPKPGQGFQKKSNGVSPQQQCVHLRIWISQEPSGKFKSMFLVEKIRNFDSNSAS